MTSQQDDGTTMTPDLERPARFPYKTWSATWGVMLGALLVSSGLLVWLAVSPSGWAVVWVLAPVACISALSVLPALTRSPSDRARRLIRIGRRLVVALAVLVVLFACGLAIYFRTAGGWGD